jgi:hypothetical protein
MASIITLGLSSPQAIKVFTLFGLNPNPQEEIVTVVEVAIDTSTIATPALDTKTWATFGVDE